ncbi:MAG: PIN domain-containing protein [Halieaceae bacterium]|nr:PIN domain-containing protein [Halieaceae bacterium]
MLRPNGDPLVRGRVETALTAGLACWCPLVQLELWNGARGQQEQKVLREFASILPELPIDNDVWEASYDLARRARVQGITVAATDVVIAACALHHGVSLETADTDFDRLSAVRKVTR